MFQDYWDQVGLLIDKDEIKSPDEVLREIKKKEGDELHRWVKTKADKLFHPLDELVQESVTEILSKFPRMVMEYRDRNAADPWVIGLARVIGDTVVTEEVRRGTKDKPSIPFVCDHFKVPCINTLDFIRAQGWRFSLST